MKKICFVMIAVILTASCDLGYSGKQTAVEKTVYTITHGDYSGGKITRTPDKKDYRRNEEVTLSAAVDEGFVFSGWGGTIESSEKSITVTMDKNYELTPVFTKIPVFSITVEYTDTGLGEVVITPDKKEYLEGDEVTIQAVPNAGCRFIEWGGDYTDTDDPEEDGESEEDGSEEEIDPAEENGEISLIMDKDYVIKPVFEKIADPKSYRIESINIEGAGTVTVDPVKDAYLENETVVITAVSNVNTVASNLSCTALQYDYDPAVKKITVRMNGDISIQANFIERKWTYIVYMAADNDLEAAAVQDFNELEAVDYSDKPVSILVLLDRSPHYDATNGNWSGTRLYEITSDEAGFDGVIRSKQVTCTKLDLSPDYNTNLNTSDGAVLRSLIEYAQSNYTALSYGLIMWGHGTGWRGRSVSSYNEGGMEKAFALDDTAKSYMTTSAFGNAVDGKGVSVIGFDTCFGSLLETAYELKGRTLRMIASEGAVPAAGWDYYSLFSTYLGGNLSVEDFCSQAVEQFKKQYAGQSKCTISDIDITKIHEVKIAVDNLGKQTGALINSTAVRNEVLSLIKNETLSFSHSSYPCDLYIDLYALSKKLGSSYAAVSVQAQNLRSSLEAAVLQSWSSFSNEGYNLGIFFAELESPGVISSLHSPSYIQGSSASDQSKFVKESDGWVPHSGGGNSLLDKILYEDYD